MSNTYTIKRNSTGDRFVYTSDGRRIPADIAGLCVGRDKWLSEIKCKCRDCGELFPLRELQGNGQWCETCATADIND